MLILQKNNRKNWGESLTHVLWDAGSSGSSAYMGADPLLREGGLFSTRGRKGGGVVSNKGEERGRSGFKQGGGEGEEWL